MRRLGLVKLGAMLIVGMLMVPACASAVEWDFYGSARVQYFYNSVDKETIDNYGNSRATGDGDNDDNALSDGLQGNARIGARVDVSDQIYGRFEYGTGVNLRILYGQYKFGAGHSILVGQYYTPISGLTSGQVVDGDDNLNSVGAVDGPRSAMLRYKKGGLKVALIENYGKEYGSSIPTLNASFTETDVQIPKIEASYEFSNDTISIMPFVGWQTYDVETTGTGQTSESIMSYLMGVHGRFKLGPAYVNVSGHWAQNAGNYGLFERGAQGNITATTVTQNSPAFGSQAQLVNGDIEDASTYGCALVVGFSASEKVSIEAGIGYVNHEVDVAAGTWEDDTIAYYVNAPITVAKNFTITPEIGIYDFGDLDVGTTSQKEGQRLYYGAKFQINF